MRQDDILELARKSIRDNRKVLSALGRENNIRVHHQEEDLIDALKELMPKSTEGKLVVAGLVGLVAWYLLKK